MANYKAGRINEDVKRCLATILPDIKDPRIPPMPTIVAVEVTGDLRYAKVRLSFLSQYDEKEVMRGLKAANGYIRKRLGDALSLRAVPELVFVLDHSLEKGAEIDRILKNLQ